MTRMMTAAVLATGLGASPAGAGQTQPWVDVFAVPTADRAELVYQMTENVAECASMRLQVRIRTEPSLGAEVLFGEAIFYVELSTRAGRADLAIYNRLGVAMKVFRRFTPTGAVKDACEWIAAEVRPSRER